MAEARGIMKAVDADGNIIDIEDVPDRYDDRGTYTCPLCQGRLVARKGQKRIHHFAHRHAGDCDPWAGGMTAWHLGGQKALECAGMTLEVPFDDVDDEGHRHRLDAFFEREDGTRAGIELQHSPMSGETFTVRTDFYLAHLDELIWIFDVRHKDICEVGCEHNSGWWHWAECRLGKRLHMRWARAAVWSYGSWDDWYSRGMTVFLYVCGFEDFHEPERGDGGRGFILEVTGKSYWTDEFDAVLWDTSSWLKAMAAKRSFPSYRMRTVRYEHFDGTCEEIPCREGLPLPAPMAAPPLQEGQARGEYKTADGKPAPDRVGQDDVTLVGTTCWRRRNVTVRRSDTGETVLRELLPASLSGEELDRRLREGIADRHGEELARNLKWVVPPSQGDDDVTLKAFVPAELRTHSVRFVDQRYHILWKEEDIAYGTPLREVAVRAYRAIPEPKRFLWPSSFPEVVGKDADSRIVLPDRQV